MSRVNTLIDRAYELGLQGLALTDHDTVSGYIQAEKYVRKKKEENPDDEAWQNFKLILGNEIYLCRNGLNKDNFDSDKDSYFHFILLAKDRIGNDQIRRISSRAWSRSYMYFHNRVPTYWSDLEEIIQAEQGHVIGSSACFRKGTKVTTKEGAKPIEEITSNDMIVNRYGEWEQVNYPTKRHYKGKGIKLNIVGNEEPIVATANHQFLIFSNSSKNLRWYTGEELRTRTGAGKSILVEPLEKINYSGNDIINKEEYYETISKDINRRISLPEKIKITPEVMRLFGLYLGDGHTDIKNKRIGFTLNITEFDAYYNSFIKPAGDQLGITWSIVKRPKNNRVDINSGSVDLVELFYYLFKNQKANTKEIPKRLLNISRELDFELMFGYMLADGYFRTRMDAGKATGYESGEFTGASVSEQLAYDFYNLLNSYGITTSIKSYAERADKNNVFHQKSWYIRSANKTLGRVNKLQEYSHEEVLSIFNQAIADKKARDTIELEGVLYRRRRIQSVEFFDMDEEVHCLNVDSHSFLCEGVIVHNCLGGQLPKLIMGQKRVESNNQAYLTYENSIKKLLEKWVLIFGEGNFYMELQPGVTNEQIIVNKKIKELSKETGIPCIVTTDTHYIKQEDRPIHAAFLNSKQGDRETADFYEATYMMSVGEIRDRMSYLGDDFIDELLLNTINIGKECQEYSLIRDLSLPYLPQSKFDEELLFELNVDTNKYPYFEKFYNSTQSDKQLIVRLWNFMNTDPYTIEHLDETLEGANRELEITWNSSEKMGVKWSKYFLQVADYLKIVWTLGDSIAAPSRGSAGASYILYTLGVIQINPNREKAPLIFERFLNPDRVSVLDIDTDVESDKRQRCIAALQHVYGEDRVIRVSTFRTETTKSVIKTAGRGLGIEMDTYAYIASLITSSRGIDYSLDEMYYGDEKKDIKPHPTFVKQMNQYPELWNAAKELEGIITGIGVHAGGVIIDDKPIYETAGIMRTNNGDLVTSFDLDDCEEVSLIKIDLLSTKALSKIRACLDLLCDYGYVTPGSTLRETYEKVIGVYNLDRTNSEMWEMTWRGEIIALFQMEKQSGVAGIKLTKPESVEDLATLNSVIRLQAPERGMEQPLEKYARFREHPEYWEQEMLEYGLDEGERELMHNMFDHSNGISAQQEDLYQIILEPKIAGFSFGEADKLRKIVAKKEMDQVEGYHEKVVNNAKKKGLSKNLVTYAWEQMVMPQAGYSFNLAHTLSYSLVALQEMNLAYHYPIIFWNTANLIVDSGTSYQSYDYYNVNSDFQYENKDDGQIDYGKVASAIGRMQQEGVTVSAPNVNKSNRTFTPDVENNTIRYGLTGITGVNSKIVDQILEKRLFNSVDDFKSRVEGHNVTTVVNLIKSGAFDDFGERKDLMREELINRAGFKNRLNLNNANMLIQQELLPKSKLDMNIRVFNFNKHIKQKQFYNKDEGTYFLDQNAYPFFEQNFDMDQVYPTEDGYYIYKNWWKPNVYDKYMDDIRTYIKEHEKELLEELNEALLQEQMDKYASGTLATWSMDSLSFYQAEHELDRANLSKYGIRNWSDLREEPEVDYTFTIEEDGLEKEIKMFKLCYIAGTVIDKNKNKSQVTILTTDGVVNVKAYGIFPQYDKRISETLPNGQRKIIEKSMFTRGNIIMVFGMRRGSEFIAKKYKNSTAPHHFRQITEIKDNGDLVVTDRTKDSEEV